MTLTSSVQTPSESELAEIILAVRQLVQDETNLRCSTTDNFLLRFIRASKYDVKESHKLVQEYFRAKLEDPDSYALKLPVEFLSTYSRLDLGYVIDNYDVFGRRIAVVKLGDLDPYKEVWSDIVGAILCSCEALSLERDVQDNGITAVLDCTNFSLKLMKWATPKKFRVIFRFLNVCMPMRFEAYHVVNAPLIFNTFYAAVRPFLNAEFLKKLKWHKHPYTELHQCIHPSLLPLNMGGSLELDSVKDWHHLVTEKAPLFEEIMKMGYIE